MCALKVFISYSHDSDEHRERVLALSERLRGDGIETLLDQYVNGSPPEGWPRWMLNQLDAANFVLVVCTETYYRRFRGHEESGNGKGVDWEGTLITQAIYDQRSQTLKFVPVLWGPTTNEFVPEPLRSLTRYPLTSEGEYKLLVDFVKGCAGVEPRPVGPLTLEPRRQGAPLSFGDAAQSTAKKIDISRIVEYAPEKLIGREAETKLLSDAWDQVHRGETKRPHVITFVALGGEGKTSLVAKWAVELAHRDWPGCDSAFAWSFYSQGTREQVAASSDLFLKEALTFFGDPATAESALGAFEKGTRLARLVGEQRAILILDGLEPLQYAPGPPMDGKLKDAGLSAMLKGLATDSRGLCVITSRYSILNLKAFRQTTAPEVPLSRLSQDSGMALLHSLGVLGSRQELAKLVEEIKGHALTLNLLGTYLRDAHAGDIRKRDLVKLEEADAEESGGHAFRVMDSYIQWLESEGERGRRAVDVLKLLGLFDRPASANCIAALLKTPTIPNLTEALVGMSESQRNLSFRRLESAKLLTVNRDGAGTLLSLDAHPLLRDYLARKLSTQQPDAWRGAHRRLYDYLCESTREGDNPTLEELQPLYQAVAHGCQAEMYQDACNDVFHARILKNDDRSSRFYSTRILGTFGSDLSAIACFFETPFSRPAATLSEAAHAWLLGEAAFDLRALGRLREALDPMRAAVEMELREKNWSSAATVAGNMSELLLTLGDVEQAVQSAERCQTYSDQSNETFVRLKTRVAHADALFQAGRRMDGDSLFREAEEMQALLQPEKPLLYSFAGFRYCDFLLAEAERAAWQQTLNSSRSGPEEKVLASCRAVSQRAEQTLNWADKATPGLLSIALEWLARCRVAFFQAVLQRSDMEDSSRFLREAMEKLRRAGTTHHLPRALLTRAWLRSLVNSRIGVESAQEDLDEVWEIAERGPMPLFLADIHLHRARLYFRESAYPWKSPATDLAEARRLIEKHGYGRRKEELEDAEAVILK